MNSSTTQALPNDLSRCELGITRTLFSIEKLVENQLAANHLIRDAQTSIDIFTARLDHRVFDQEAIIEALRQLAVNNTRTQIRILIREPQFIISQGHRILELQRRLTSYISMRQAGTNYAQTGKMYIIADQRGYLYKESDERYEGLVNFNEPAQCREWLNQFNEAWEHSQPITDFRRLHI